MDLFTVDFLVQYGYLGIICFLVLTGCGLPVPEEVFIIIAGVASSQGHLEAEWAIAACLFGAIVGDSVMYAIGYHYGHSLMAKHPKLGKFVGADREEQFENAILRHGFKVMLLSRFMVGVRGPVYLAAGTVRMPYRRFLLWDLICATLVVGTFFGLSYFYGEQITQLVRDAEVTFTLVVFLIGLSAGLWWMRRRRHQTLGEAIDRHAEHGPLTKLGTTTSTPSHQKSAPSSKASEDVA